MGVPQLESLGGWMGVPQLELKLHARRLECLPPKSRLKKKKWRYGQIILTWRKSSIGSQTVLVLVSEPS